jgi:hypothetical protein
MARNGDVMRSDRLKQVMQQIDPNFDERNAGFNRFSKFVSDAAPRAAQGAKLDNGQFEVAPIAGTGAAPSRPVSLRRGSGRAPRGAASGRARSERPDAPRDAAAADGVGAAGEVVRRRRSGPPASAPPIRLVERHSGPRSASDAGRRPSAHGAGPRRAALTGRRRALRPGMAAPARQGRRAPRHRALPAAPAAGQRRGNRRLRLLNVPELRGIHSIGPRRAWRANAGAGESPAPEGNGATLRVNGAVRGVPSAALRFRRGFPGADSAARAAADRMVQVTTTQDRGAGGGSGGRGRGPRHQRRPRKRGARGGAVKKDAVPAVAETSVAG